MDTATVPLNPWPLGSIVRVVVRAAIELRDVVSWVFEDHYVVRWLLSSVVVTRPVCRAVRVGC